MPALRVGAEGNEFIAGSSALQAERSCRINHLASRTENASHCRIARCLFLTNTESLCASPNQLRIYIRRVKVCSMLGIFTNTCRMERSFERRKLSSVEAV